MTASRQAEKVSANRRDWVAERPTKIELDEHELETTGAHEGIIDYIFPR
jgi:hypothetical protein